MSAPETTNNVAVAAAPPSAAPARRPRSTKGLARAMRVDDADLDARRKSACVLEVLAGVRSPEEAAAALALPLASYFQLEERALRGLVAGCMPQPRGRAPDLTKALDESRRLIGELEREVQRHQALLRSAQRAAGLVGDARAAGTARPSPAAAAPRAASRSAGRRPRVRALRAVAALRGDGGRESGTGGAPAATDPAPAREPSAQVG